MGNLSDGKKYFVLIKIMKEHYFRESYTREGYFEGKRDRWLFGRRARRSLDTRDTPSTRFDVFEVLNGQPDAKGVVSISLFGDSTSPRFRPGLVKPLLRSSRIIEDVLPGWVIRVYVSESIPQSVRQELIDAGCEVYVMGKMIGVEGLCWRFLVAGEDKPFIVHDADMPIDVSTSFFPPLEKHVTKWLNSDDQPFLRRKNGVVNVFDHIPLCGGMWGGKPTKEGVVPLADIKDRMEKYEYNYFGSDETFLKKEVWPLFKKEGYYSISTTAENSLLLLLVLVPVIIIVVLTCVYGRRYWKANA